jgi:hypothetical protein
MFSASSLFASLVWGSIGVGYFIYGKKQQALTLLSQLRLIFCVNP